MFDADPRYDWDTFQHVMSTQDIAELLDFVAAVPQQAACFQGLGLVQDARVRGVLRRLRRTPGMDVQQLIGELALAGDFASKRELDEMRSRHLYGWFDDAAEDVRTLGRSLDLMPYLIGEVETVCCRRNGVASAIEHLTGFEVGAQSEDGLVTQHDHALQWWQQVGKHLVWSRIARKFVVAPH